MTGPPPTVPPVPPVSINELSFSLVLDTRDEEVVTPIRGEDKEDEAWSSSSRLPPPLNA